MSFLVIVCTLLVVHYLPQSSHDLFNRLAQPYLHWVALNFNAGRPVDGKVAWLITILLPVLLLAAAYYACWLYWRGFAYVVAVATMVKVLSNAHFNRRFSLWDEKLQTGEINAAKALYTQHGQTQQTPADEVSLTKLVLQQELIHAHQALFAPLMWFLLLGPAGAVLYRLSKKAAQIWQLTGDNFGLAAVHYFHWLDYIPARLTAAGFAAVGDFEAAASCWRNQAKLWQPKNDGVVLASAAGALGVKLGEQIQYENGSTQTLPEIGMGDDADATAITSAAGLLWRTLLLLLSLVFLFNLASGLGST